MQIAVLGTGLVGKAIVEDLAKENELQIIAADIDPNRLKKIENKKNIQTKTADLTNNKILLKILMNCDLVINALPGSLGYQTLKKIIECGKNVVDISFFSEDPFELDRLAKSNNITAVVDCGVAPGLCNIWAGHLNVELDQIEEYSCYVGGLPQTRLWPFEYKAVFSPSDVIEEYTRPVRLVEKGQIVIRSPLSDIEMINFPGIGSLEAFNTDGLRTLIKTLKIPNMREKTIRYPGHANLMRIFRESGFFSRDPIEINGQKIKPLQLTSTLLFKQWQLEESEKDMTLMRVIIKGKKEKKNLSHTFNLIDHYDTKTHTTSMARTTGYTCTIVVRQVLNGLFKKRGVSPPEYIGANQPCYHNLCKELKKYKINIEEEIITQP